MKRDLAITALFFVTAYLLIHMLNILIRGSDILT